MAASVSRGSSAMQSKSGEAGTANTEPKAKDRGGTGRNSRVQAGETAGGSDSKTAAGAEAKKKDSVAPEKRSRRPDGSTLIKCKYGWLTFEPEWLQILHRPWCLLVCLCYLAVVQGFIVNGVFPAITTQLERRYHIGSDEVGVINCMYDVGSLLMMLPISHFGAAGHKGRWIGIGAIVMGLGSFLCLVPHIATGRYAYSSVNTTDICLNAVASMPASEEAAGERSSLRNWKYLFMLGHLLHGIGASPFFTLAITYMDENVSQRTSSLYVGIFHACNLLGPTLGYVFAGLTLSTHVDFNKAGVNTGAVAKEDPRWVGAWWLGVIVSGCAAWFMAPFMLGFGRQLPGADKARIHDVNQAYQVTAEDQAHAPEAFRDCSCLFQRMRLLVRNPTYLGLVIDAVCTLFIVGGMIVFLTKFIEVQYGKPTNTATLYAAGAAIPAAFIGTLLGTILQRAFRLHCNGNLILSIVSTTGAFLCCSAFFAHCPTQPFAGVNVPYPLEVGGKSKIEFAHACHRDCGCSKSFYRPVCANENNTMLFSSCYAGCSQTDANGTAGTCACLPNNGSVHIGVCENQCSNAMFILFMLGLAFIILCIYVKQNPVQQATLRCVPFELRTFAVAIGFVPMRLLGSIPASPAMGAIVKATCLLWRERDNVKEVCLLYDNGRLATYLQITAAVGFAVSFISLMVAWRLYLPPSTGEPVKGKEGGALQESLQTSLSEGGVVRT